jgi:hypothetical protein
VARVIRKALVAAVLGVLASFPANAERLQSWRAVLIAGDDSIAVFDNGVDALAKILATRPGVEIKRLTSNTRLRTAQRRIANAKSIEAALNGTKAQGCLVFMTSHGSVDGLLLHEDQNNNRNLSPARLDRMLDKECGDRPTVVIASACHSGVFITRASKGDNRIWLTAARDDRRSFGCGAEFEFTYFDECLLKSWPKAKTWQQLSDRTNTCVRLKESELSENPSLPQSFFGKSVKDLELP